MSGAIPGLPLKPPAGAWRPESEYFLRVLGTGDTSKAPKHVKHFLKRQAEATRRREASGPPDRGRVASSSATSGAVPSHHSTAVSIAGAAGIQDTRCVTLDYDVMMSATRDTDPTEVGEISLKDRRVSTPAPALGGNETIVERARKALSAETAESAEGDEKGKGKPSRPTDDNGDNGGKDNGGSGLELFSMETDWAAAFLSLTTLDLTGTACHVNALLRLPFPSLRVLTMACCAMGGPVSVPMESSVASTVLALDLSFNALGGEDLAEIGKITGLKVLNMAGNDISALPRLDGLFPSLAILSLESNALDESSWASLQPLRMLRELNVSANRFTGVSFEPGCVPIPLLARVDLSRNLVINPPSLSGLSELPSLEHVFLEGNPFITATRDRGVPLLTSAIAGRAKIDVGAIKDVKRRGVGIASVVYTVPDDTPAASRKKGKKTGDKTRSKGKSLMDSEQVTVSESGGDAGGFFITQDPNEKAAAAVVRPEIPRYEDMSMEERLRIAFFDGVELDHQLAQEKDIRRLYKKLRNAVEKRVSRGPPKLATNRAAVKRDSSARKRATEAAENRLQTASARVKSLTQPAKAAGETTESYMAQLDAVIASMRDTLSSVEMTLDSNELPIRREIEDRYKSLYMEVTEGESPPPIAEFSRVAGVSNNSSAAIYGNDGDVGDGAMSPSLAAEIEALKRELDAELVGEDGPGIDAGNDRVG